MLNGWHPEPSIPQPSLRYQYVAWADMNDGGPAEVLALYCDLRIKSAKPSSQRNRYGHSTSGDRNGASQRASSPSIRANGRQGRIIS